METFKLGYGDANAVAALVGKIPPGLDEASAAATAQAAPQPPGDLLDTLYGGPKVHLRAAHEAVMKVVRSFGDFEEARRRRPASACGAGSSSRWWGPPPRTRSRSGSTRRTCRPTSA